jgi:hypothetical protein
MNEFIDARDRLSSAIETLPPRLRESNAAQLLAIVEELRRSCVLQLQVVQRVARVDVADPEAIGALHQDIEDYIASDLIDRDRTHCHNIDRVAKELRAEGNPADLAELEALLVPLRNADSDYLDDVGQLVGEAVEAVRDLDNATRLADTRAIQERFRAKQEDEVKRIKSTLTSMNDVAGKLIDLA